MQYLGSRKGVIVLPRHYPIMSRVANSLRCMIQADPDSISLLVLMLVQISWTSTLLPIQQAQAQAEEEVIQCDTWL